MKGSQSSRLKFDIGELVNEKLDLFPENIWTSKSSTFLDPAIGGGQFVKEVEKRLRNHGHSDANINKRVHGFESVSWRSNYAVNKHKLVGNYTSENFLELDGNMKFDVVLGNPAYQESKDHGKKVTGDGAPWVKFTEQAFSLAKDNGIVSFVIPDSVLAPTYDKMGSRFSILNDLFKKYNLLHLNLDTKKYFTDVGTFPISFVAKKDNNYTSTKVITKEGNITIDITNMNFIPKDYNNDSLEIHKKLLSTNLNSNLFKMRWTKDVISLDAQTEKTIENKYKVLDCHSFKPIRWSNKKDIALDKRKILVTYVGNYQCIVDDGTMGAKQSVSVRFLDDNETIESVNSFYNSKIINYVMNSNKWTQYLLSQILNYIPHPVLDKVYTDKELYKFFGLTKKEQSYIEENVK